MGCGAMAILIMDQHGKMTTKRQQIVVQWPDRAEWRVEEISEMNMACGCDLGDLGVEEEEAGDSEDGIPELEPVT